MALSNSAARREPKHPGQTTSWNAPEAWNKRSERTEPLGKTRLSRIVPHTQPERWLVVVVMVLVVIYGHDLLRLSRD
jgi:hypothetical protein